MMSSAHSDLIVIKTIQGGKRDRKGLQFKVICNLRGKEIIRSELLKDYDLHIDLVPVPEDHMEKRKECSSQHRSPPGCVAYPGPANCRRQSSNWPIGMANPENVGWHFLFGLEGMCVRHRHYIH